MLFYEDKYGNYVSTYGQTCLQRPLGIATSGEWLYVSEIEDGSLPACEPYANTLFTLTHKQYAHITAFNKRDGKMMTSWSSCGDLDGQLKKPYDLCAYGNCLYVCDKGNARIQTFL